MSRLAISALVAFGLLVGCAPLQLQNDIAAAKEICAAVAANSPLAKILEGKAPLVDISEMTLDMLSNPNLATDEEAQAVNKFDGERAICKQRLFGVVERYQPTAAPIFSQLNYKNQAILIQLIQRKISWGMANRLNYEAYLESQSRYTAQTQEEIAAARERELQRSAQLLQSLQTLAITNALSQPTPQPVPRTAFTTCNWQGAFLNCTTQ